MKLGTRLKKIVKVDPESYQLTLEFTDGFRDSVDLRFIFENARRKPLVLEVLRGQLFAKCFIESGALAWPNGYELCPDAIRNWMGEQRKHRAA